MLKKPIYISELIYKHINNDKLNFLRDIDSKFLVGNPGFVGGARYGQVENNWDLHVPDSYLGPSLDIKSTATFADITDARAIELQEKIKLSGKKLGVMWSGGIDSTTMITASIRNFKNLDNVIVFMNNYSYYENATFFHDVIEKYNFDIINIDENMLNERNGDFVITDGEPSDKLLTGGLALKYQEKYPSDMNKYILSSKDNMINFITQYVDQKFAIRYFELIQQNIKQTLAPIETATDWFYWINFNFIWTGHMIRHYSRQRYNKNTKNFDTFNTNTVNWFNTHEYQAWGFSEVGKQEKHFTNLSEYKMVAKRYIHSIAKDESAMIYKTKCPSEYQYKRDEFRHKTLVIFDDGTGIDNNEPEKLQKFIEDYCLKQ